MPFPEDSRSQESILEHLDKQEMEYFREHYLRFKKIFEVLGKKVQTGMEVANVGLSIFDILAKSVVEEKGGRYYSIIPDQTYLNIFSKRDYGKVSTVVYDVTKETQDSDKNSHKFDIVVFLETLEHLLAPDELVMENIAGLCKKSGVLLFSVPNAVRLMNRIKVLLGHNISWLKQDQLHGVFGGYGHFREYTFQEVQDLVSGQFRILKREGWNTYGKNWQRKTMRLLPRDLASTIYVEATLK